ncbi:DMT family transporter [Catenovulum maritimum]|uniref:EamA domain-containing protein n=1 Tax=Catenovulum maritimum TaxID=1513271 RepID=A0A0J8JPT7_9ALTE|nr:DMT family transporter [Catenovulum maritimum]KMT66691.1 hypothetical protein XM47_00735 [Catenovulum maritimum]
MKHKPTDNNLLGFSLSLFTAILWGLLPVSLKLVLEVLDSTSITAARFLFSGFFVFLFLFVTKRLPKLKIEPKKIIVSILLVSLGLSANYIFYVKGLAHLTPEAAQVLIQIAPFIFMLLSCLIFKEKLTLYEILGACILFVGLILFFNDRIALLISGQAGENIGILFILCASLGWSIYALFQKGLLSHFSSQQIMLYVYLIGALIYFPFSEVSDLAKMNSLQIYALIFACANTLFGYGAFAEALQHWPAYKVAAVTALAPLFTFIGMIFAVEIWPTHFVSSDLNQYAYLGGILVIIGSLAASLGKLKKAAPPIKTAEVS